MQFCAILRILISNMGNHGNENMPTAHPKLAVVGLLIGRDSKFFWENGDGVGLAVLFN